jgi:hypothetical protein
MADSVKMVDRQYDVSNPSVRQLLREQPAGVNNFLPLLLSFRYVSVQFGEMSILENYGILNPSGRRIKFLYSFGNLR